MHYAITEPFLQHLDEIASGRVGIEWLSILDDVAVVICARGG